ncbi:MAG TPA: efflux RND transporter periplasmic adaptor subunit [Candidatus Acidoferrales bacterium]|nr:efflux RND transporter periplasmic adaptor subunit [Candidatus Acidoferrales bacterium]
MNRNRWLAVVAVVLVVVIGGAWWRSRSNKSAPKFRTAAIERGDVTATVSATGSVEPVLQVQVGSQVSGTLSRLYVDYNSQVKAGQVLAQLDTSAFKAQLAQAEASKEHAAAALKNAQVTLEREIALQKGNFVAQADVDAAQAALDQAKADLKQAEASVQTAQVNLDHTTITSPINGVVISRSIDVGQTVAASLQAPQLFLIGNDLKQMEVQTSIDEADIGRVHAGLQSQFTVDAYPDATFNGQVVQVWLSPVVSSNVVTYTTLISARNDDLRLRPGMTANVTIDLETHKDVLKVANAALRFKPPGWTPGKGKSGASANATTGGQPGGAARRTISALVSALVPDAYAQDAPAPGGQGKGNWPGANDPYVQQIRAKVQSGELTRDQARDLIHKHMQELGARPGGAPPAGQPAATPGPAGAPAKAGKRGSTGAGHAPAGAPGEASPVAGSLNGSFEEHANGHWQNLQGLGFTSETGYKPGAVWLLKDGKPARVRVLTGLTDGTFTEIKSDSLKEGDLVITGLDSSGGSGAALTPPPGMGGPQFRGPGGGGRR